MAINKKEAGNGPIKQKLAKIILFQQINVTTSTEQRVAQISMNSLGVKTYLMGLVEILDEEGLLEGPDTDWK